MSLLLGVTISIILLWPEKAETQRELPPTPVYGSMYVEREKEVKEEKQVTDLPVPQVMEAIAKCESGGSHYNEDGEVIRGRVNPKDIGKYQINLTYHEERAREMGLDLFDPVDNEKYALYLYRTQGTQPWYLSEHCWSKHLVNEGRNKNEA